MTAKSDRHTAALEYAARGFSILPLGAPGETPPAWFLRKFSGDVEKAMQKWPKTPRIKWEKHQTTPATVAEIDDWFRRWPGMNIGLATGSASGIIAVDVDGPEGLRWAEKNLDIKAIQVTGQEGHCHVLFRQNGVPVPNSSRTLAPEIDIRGDGGQVVIAPSVHPSGKVYTLQFGQGITWANLPDWKEPTKAIVPDKSTSKAKSTLQEGEIIQKALAAKNGEKFKSLWQGEPGQYKSASEADQALCSLLAFWCSKDADRMDALFRQSGLMRKKWDDRHYSDGRTYGQGCIETAIRNCAEVYSPPTLDGFPPTEDGVALAFAAKYNDSLRYCHTTGSWFAWSGTRWVRERTNLAFDWCRGLCRDTPASKKEIKTLGRASTARGVEAFCRADRAFAVTSEVWDTDTFLLGTPNATVDLRTGGVIQSKREDYITKATSVDPAEYSDCPLWRKFLDEATSGDLSLQRFMKQIAGYSLTGDIREHALFFVYGNGGNGKGVFLNTITNIMGDYVATSAMETFTASKSDSHPTDLAMLQGARMVCASETEEGRSWAESRIKQLTGGDKISARFMRQDFFTFQPQFKLIIIGNHQPILNSVDDAARRRFNIIPFIHTPANPDKDLEAKLRAEYPDILRWMIEGCLDWQANGLVRPDSVQAATKAYFEDQDLFGQWLGDACAVDKTSWATTSALFESWSTFAVINGEKAGSIKSFSATMVKRGFLPDRRWIDGKTQRLFLGLSVRHDNKKHWMED